MYFKSKFTQKVQEMLRTLGETLTADGEHGPVTEAALDKFNVEIKMVRKEVATQTEPKPGEVSARRAQIADLAEAEAKKNLVWTPGSEAVKYTKFYEPWFGKGRFSWCAAFVTWCCQQKGLNVPLKPTMPDFGYTFALVETWQRFFQKNGFYFDNDGTFVPQRGDIVLFDWDQLSINALDNDWEDHIGIFLRMDGKDFICAEGNASNQTAIKYRKSVNIQGFGRIPDTYQFNT